MPAPFPNCPKCGAPINVPAEYAGALFTCDSCGTEVDRRGRRTDTQRIKQSSGAAPWEESNGAHSTPQYAPPYLAQSSYANSPRRRSARPLVIIGVALVVAVVLGFLALPLIRSPGVSNEQVTSWPEFSSPAGRYVMRMPVPPVEKTETKLANSRPIQMYFAEVMYKQRNFGAVYFDLGSGDPASFTYDYNEAALAMARAQQAQVLESGPMTVSGYPGFNVRLKNKVPGFLNQARFVRHGNRVYVLLVEAYIDADQAVVDAFLNSFRITGP